MQQILEDGGQGGGGAVVVAGGVQPDGQGLQQEEQAGRGLSSALVQIFYAGPTMLECVTILILSPVCKVSLTDYKSEINYIAEALVGN